MSAKSKSTYVQGKTLEDLVARAESRQVGDDLYSNYARITATGSEFIFDFIRITPGQGPQSPPKIIHLQRVLLPTSAVKGFATALTDVIARFESETGITLPNTREDLNNAISQATDDTQ